ncbi:MAG: cyanophycinase, partial [Phycisphaerae bacterium]|nr:cyanophycinase [Phycisphaerae bacterium]
MVLLCSVVSGCSAGGRGGATAGAPAWPTGLRGHLLAIGGGLDDDNRHVYERLVTLARDAARARNDGANLSPTIVIATAASGDQDANIRGKTQAIRAYCPDCIIGAIRRETPEAETVAAIDAADAMFFTGGDQKRITDRYLRRPPEGSPPGSRAIDTPEAAAMRRLLARGGVIAGTSAGDAMMSDPMFLTGRSAEALGIRSTRRERGPDDDEDDKRPEPPLGPQIGQGMGFVPGVIMDSHFFERHRFGRLVAAIEASGLRTGLGVGEDACVEINLATGEAIGVSVAETLVVDASGQTRASPGGLVRTGVRTRVLRQGDRVSLARPVSFVSPRPAADGSRAADPFQPPEEIALVEPGQNRQLASWRFFRRAEE